MPLEPIEQKVLSALVQAQRDRQKWAIAALLELNGNVLTGGPPRLYPDRFQELLAERLTLGEIVREIKNIYKEPPWRNC